MATMIDLERVQELVAAAVEKYPNRTNPQEDEPYRAVGLSGPGCLYTNRRRTKHCIAGQVLEDAGLPVPDYGTTDNNDAIGTLDVAHDHFTSDALEYLECAQYVFDGGSLDPDPHPLRKRSPRRWKSALNLLNKNLQLVKDRL